MPSLTSLDAAAQERKARLAKLKNLKRKQPEPGEENDDNNNNNTISDADADGPASKYPKSPSATAVEGSSNHRTNNDDDNDVSKKDGDQDHGVTSTYLSGRNYDPETRGPRLGFEVEPAANQPTLEADAIALAAETQKQAKQDAKPDKPLDLFTLRPKKPNWDLKRDLDAKLQILNVRTENAIAKLVRERIEEAKKASVAAQKKQNGSGDAGKNPDEDGNGEAIGMDGVALVEAMHMREREEEEDEKRERNDENMDDGS